MFTVPTNALILLIPSGLVSIWAYVSFKKELRQTHPSEWRWLNQGDTLPGTTIVSEIRWTAFIVSRKYVNLENRRLTLLGNAILICGIINFAIMLLWAFAPSFGSSISPASLK